MRRRFITGVVALSAAIAWAGCATTMRTHEPPNLTLLKKEIRAYVESGQYERDIAAVAAQAKAWIEQRAARRAPGERLTVVFDLDETLLLNWPYMSRNDIGYIPAAWDAWVETAAAPPIEPVRELYRAARRLAIDVVFITGRTERTRAATDRNLRAIDCADYAALICRPDNTTGTSAARKTAERAKLARAGHVIVANIGDQQSDLAGGFAERTFKLPGPFYLTE
jgi:predicted secreted acid phosphatase